MSDTPAQPTQGLAHRFVGDPNSAIGTLIKRGFTGSARAVKNPLDVLENVIDEVEISMPKQETTPESQLAAATAEGVMSQVMPQVMTQTANSLDPSLTAAPNPRKEAIEQTAPDQTSPDQATLDQVATEAAANIQKVEQGQEVEIPPEIEGYLKEVADHKETAPKEVVIADGSQTSPLDHQYPAQPVVVLPITPEEEKTGAKKSPKFSIRWLVEWSQRLMKMFVGKIIYRPTESTA